MVFEPNGKGRLNCFALVSYIPDPLAKFFDDLRKELVPGFVPHAHVTILPPRRMHPDTDPDAAAAAARSVLADVPSFELEAGDIEVFQNTHVVYVSIGKGVGKLRELHDLANVGPLHFQEPFPYHPHITLAQDIGPERCLQLEKIARQRWADYRHSRLIPVETLTFVQCTMDCSWVDLADVSLAAPVPSVR